jgi:ferredoxin
MLCARSHAEVVVKSGQTLLEAAEEGGVSIDSLCRAGVCGTCRIQVTAGDVECDSTSLDAGERAEGYVLACVSTPQSDCTVNA